MSSPTESRVRDVLAEVYDPCSCYDDDPIDVVSMGLIESIDIEDGEVAVSLLPTSPMCMYVAQMTAEIERRVGDLPGVRSVEVRQVTDEIWTRDRMDEEVREARRERFRDRVDDLDVTPYAESESG